VHGLTPANIRRSIDQTLASLRTDCVDIYFMYHPDAEVPVEESLRTLDDLMQAGKVRHVGASNHTGAQFVSGLKQRVIVEPLTSSRHLQCAAVPHDDLRSRLGTGPGGPNIEDGLQWAANNGFFHVDFNADHGANHLRLWDDDRIHKVRTFCQENGMHLGIHTLSFVNIAEFSPFLTEAVDAYLRAMIDLGKRLGVERIIAHAGLHQSSELELRKKASIEHLKRATEYAENQGITLLLENLNHEPDNAEVHYMGHSIEELHAVFDVIQSPHLLWGFSANHMHLLPGDFDAFVDEFGVGRIGLVLVADNRGLFEEHLLPGQGTMDFKRLFGRLEGDGYRGPYMLTFGNREQKIAGREYLLAQAGVAGTPAG